MLFVNSFALSVVEGGTSGALERGDNSRFSIDVNTIINSPKVKGAKFLGSDRLFCFISIYKFGSFENPFATITSLPEFLFRCRRFILLVQRKDIGSDIDSDDTTTG